MGLGCGPGAEGQAKARAQGWRPTTGPLGRVQWLPGPHTGAKRAFLGIPRSEPLIFVGWGGEAPGARGPEDPPHLNELPKPRCSFLE